MADKYLELRINRDFGDILSVYFDFLKQNIKTFTNVFLRYNGIFIIGLLITSYLLVSGFVGLIAADGLYGNGSGTVSEEDYLIYLFSGLGIFFVIFMIVAALNFSISSSYLVKYDETKGNLFDKKEVWNLFKDRLGSILLFIVILVPIYLVFIVVVLITAFIPLAGIFIQYVLQFFLAAWVGVSFFCMLTEKKGVMDAFGEGWSLVINNFWKSIGVNFILGLLNGLLFFIIMVIPGVIIGIYTFHVVENNVDVTGSVISMVIYTLALCLVLVASVYAQCLSQFVNGILYYALHEKTYNVNTRSKIEEIGESNL
ncbi:hypothetical protein ACOKFD_00220 [Flagellimonas sp. S174]|uniref:hypothetical protein n=1 Tax=Flagellimonas sp. S174 TaxID=3410790 RepID=UPI003BF540FF